MFLKAFHLSLIDQVIIFFFTASDFPFCVVPMGSPSHGGDVTVYVRHKPTKLAHTFCSILVSVCVYLALLTVFHSMNSPDNSSLSHSVLLALFLP